VSYTLPSVVWAGGIGCEYCEKNKARDVHMFSFSILLSLFAWLSQPSLPNLLY
jgi:hypothetical protein